MTRSILVLAALLAAPPVAAAPVAGSSEAVQLLNRGEWANAASVGRRQGDPTGFTVAARADLVRAAYFAGSRPEAMALVDNADRLLANAVENAPTDFYVQLVEASAVGYRATLEHSRSLGIRTRKLMTRLTEEHPKRSEGWLALGAWHGEAVIRLGGFLARTALGASRAQMERNLETAAALDPRDPLAPAYLGLFLVRMGEEQQALPLLRRAAAMKGRDAYEAMYQRSAQTVLKLLEKGDKKAARQTANSMAAFGKFAPAGGG